MSRKPAAGAVVIGNAIVVNNEITKHPDQVAGHGDLLKDKTAGCVYKPIIPIEHFFYESAMKEHTMFLPFIPKYHGVVAVPRDGQPSQFISLEDISHRYKKPSIMDIKMGITQHLEGMSEEKKALAVAKCKSSSSYTLGFRICGIKVYNKEKSEYASWDRFWGRDVPSTEIVPAVNNFFNFTQFRDELINYYVEEMTKLLPVMRDQKYFRFVSSSLLFMFEGEPTNKSDLQPQVKMIDFANTLPIDPAEGRNEIDEGYVMGLENIIKVLNEIKEIPRESPPPQSSSR